VFLKFLQYFPASVYFLFDSHIFGEEVRAYSAFAYPLVVPKHSGLHFGGLHQGVHDDQGVIFEGHFDLLRADRVELNVETGMLFAQI
jgi:hypothetical protein